MLKALKSLFIIEEEDPKASKSREKTVKKVTQTPKTTASSMPESAKGRAGKVEARFTNILLQAMDANNLDGFDYLEFKQSLQSLSNMPMDEATRFKSAFAMAQTMNATVANLVKTGGHYINILKQEEHKFEEALKNQQNQQVNAKIQEVKGIESGIQAKAEQIKLLSKEIESQQKQVEGLKNQINSATIKMENTKNDFIASFNLLVSQIDQDIENIKKYLGNQQGGTKK
ncbi:MAG: hypothetical protein MK226_12845 [Saprospiraceae bacterium]|nr:hypothetical protein [Saprospiraceae bacterium]